MEGLFEFVFERVPSPHLARMVFDLLRDKLNVTEVARDGEAVAIEDMLAEEYLAELSISEQDTAINISLMVLHLEETKIPRATVRVIRYDRNTDFSVLVNSTDCKAGGIHSSNEIYTWARSVSEKYGIENFFGGLDPAFDEHTQLYSSDGPGPILEF